MDVDVTQKDILQMGAMRHVKLLYDDRIGASLDVAYINLGETRNFFPKFNGRVDATLKQLSAEGFLSYRFWHENKNCVEAYAGGRYWFNQIEPDSTLAGYTFRNTNTQQWLDPVIGLLGEVFVADKWSLFGSGNIGGFGIASEFTWSVQTGIGYQFNDALSLHLQYKATGVDHDNGKSGKDAFVYDTVTQGPILGLAYKF